MPDKGYFSLLPSVLFWALFGKVQFWIRFSGILNNVLKNTSFSNSGYLLEKIKACVRSSSWETFNSFLFLWQAWASKTGLLFFKQTGQLKQWQLCVCYMLYRSLISFGYSLFLLMDTVDEFVCAGNQAA